MISPTQLIPPIVGGTCPEHELLFCCARTYIDIKTTERIQTLVQTEIDWSYLIRTASEHGIMPLLYWSLSQTCAEAIPETALTQLKESFCTNVAHNLAWTSELLQILDLLTEHNIPAVPFKGPALAVLGYGNLALRQFSDLDLLIHKQDAIKLKNLLLVHGYQQVSGPPLTPAQELMYLRAACEYRFLSPDGKVALEPHWSFAKTKYGISLDFEPLWHRLTEMSLAGTQVSTFSPEDSLLIVCINGTKDQWSSLKNICDVAAIIYRHPQFNWHLLIEQAEVIGCKRILLLGLFLASNLLEIELPEIVWQSMTTEVIVQKLALQVRQRLFDRSARPSKRLATNFLLWDIHVRERWQDKIWYCFNLVFGSNEGDAKFVSLPVTLYWVYPVLRPFRLAARLGSDCLKVVWSWITPQP